MRKKYKEIIERENYNLEQTCEVYQYGEGILPEDIAKAAGIYNKTNNNPNKRLINEVAKDLGLEPSGITMTEWTNTSNGGMGAHISEKYQYDPSDIKKIHDYIRENSVLVKKSEYRYGDITYRIGFINPIMRIIR